MDKKKALLIESEDTLPFPMESLPISELSIVERATIEQMHKTYSTEVYDIVLCNMTKLNDSQLTWLQPLVQRNPHTQFLVLAQQISISAYRQMALHSHIITLQQPCARGLIENLIKELILRNKAGNDHRSFPRFITDEPVRMIVMDTGLLIPTRMLNYSSGGAFLEYKGISLKVGYQLKVNFIKQDTPKDKSGLQLDARVVWVRDGDGRSKTVRGVGVQFADHN